jgi:hypothetical protein
MREGYTQTAVYLKRFNLRSALARSAIGAIDRSKWRCRYRWRPAPASEDDEAFQWTNPEALGMDVEC